jgi:ABC-2 type transport system permease protein
MLKLLLQQRFWVWRNSLLRGSRRKQTGYLAFLVFSGFLIVNLYRASKAAFELMSGLGAPSVLLLTTVFSGVLVFVLLWGLGTILVRLYLTSDLELLLVSPISRRTVFTLKLLEGVESVFVPASMVATILVAYGQALRVGWGYYPLALAALMAVLLLLTSLSMLVVMLIVRWLPAQRARELWTFLWVLCFGAVWFGWMILSSGNNDPLQRVGGWATVGATFGRKLGWTPAAWAGNVLAAFVGGAWGSLALNAGLLLGCTAAVLALTYAVYERSFYRGWTVMQEVPLRRPGKEKRRAEKARRRRGIGLLRWLPWPAGVIVYKDWTVLPRDLRWLSGLVMPLLLAGFYVYNFGFRWQAARGQPEIAFWLAVAITPLVPCFSVSAMATTSIPAEGRNFELLRAAPISARGVLWGKFWMSFPLILVLGEVIGLLIALLMGVPAGQLLLLMGFNALLIALFVAWSVAAGMLTPDFEAEHPRRAAGTGGTYATMLGCLLIWLAAVCTLALVVLNLGGGGELLRVGRQALMARVSWGWLLGPVGLPVILALDVLLVGGVAWLWRFAAQRIEAWQPGAG